MFSNMKYKPNRRTITAFDTVFNVTADFYGVSVEEILGRRRYQAIVEPRFVSIHLAKMISKNIAWASIGWYVDRDHQSCMYADSQVRAWKDTDKKFAAKLEQVARRVASVL